MIQTFGCIEAGGTKFICAIADVNGNVLERHKIDTTDPKTTMSQVISFFKDMEEKYTISAMGIGAFGPVDPDLESETYGYITTTPKKGWNNCNIVGELKKHFDMPMGFDTDVNAAALGEHYLGAAKGYNDFIYITVGTGVGAGIMSSGKMIHGDMHPELGHVFVPQDKQKDNYAGCCKYHDNCLEGLASGTAICDRWGVKGASELPVDHKAWDLESDYLSYALVNCILTLSPKKIILGGGVMKQLQLFPMIHKKTAKLLSGYVSKIDLKRLEDMIVPPSLGDNAGVSGALAIAKNSLSVTLASEDF